MQWNTTRNAANQKGL